MFNLKATHKPVKAYYEALATFQKQGHTTEGNTRSAFADLLKRCASGFDWHLVEEYQFKGTNKQPLRADGALVDSLTLVHGLWEAKDSADDLPKEIKAKVAKGYPLTNILFQSPDRAVLYQDNRIALDADLRDPEKLIDVLELFFNHRQPHEVDWEEAVLKFSEKIPDLAEGVTVILEAEYKKNADFREKFLAFAELCRQSINPDLTNAAIQKMLVQHLLTERIFRRVFNNSEFLTRNVIAAEIEKVIHSITAKHFSRDTFLKPLDRFYTAIEKAAESQEGYTEKQHFLNAVYEKFFQSFDKKQADTHGIVYTPQPIVDFMVRSLEEVLKSEFGKSLSDEGVHILDPFTGTGNFITRIIQQIKTSRLQQKYESELHCNEIMLLPYYIASMNIEHAYMERLQRYAGFEGICLVDTFELSESEQAALFTAENAARVRTQKLLDIRVVVGNPPYNASQKDEDDVNANRKYSALDRRIRQTYIKSSAATLSASLSDPYVRAFRWASDRVGDHGVVCYISNNSYLDGIAFDGFRKCLEEEYDKIYIVDLGGNVRQNPKLSGTTHNVFGIQVGVAITVLIRHEISRKVGPSEIRYASLPTDMKRGAKYTALNSWNTLSNIPWRTVRPDSRFRWFSEDEEADFSRLLPLAAQTKRTIEGTTTEGLFRSYSNAPQSNNDKYVYSFSPTACLRRARNMKKAFNDERLRWLAAGKPKDLSAFLRRDLETIKWIRKTRKSLARKRPVLNSDITLRCGLYRPFTVMAQNFTRIFNEDLYSFQRYYPSRKVMNTLICVPAVGARTPYWCIASALVPSRTLTSVDTTQCFPFYTYNEDGTDRQENITDWALDQYRAHYKSQNITKWHIFHSTYALLHHPEYRARYAANLKRELPRIPFPPDIEAFAKAGKRLMELHIDYEKQPEYPLEEIESPKVKWTLRVEKMSLGKDKTELRYNEALTLRGIPPQTFEYRLGNRSALDWVIDQYRVSTDKRSGIVNDPNRKDDERYILRLIGQVITVSLETMKIVNSLPTLNLGSE